MINIRTLNTVSPRMSFSSLRSSSRLSSWLLRVANCASGYMQLKYVHRQRQDNTKRTFIADLFLQCLHFVRVMLVANSPGRHDADTRMCGEEEVARRWKLDLGANDYINIGCLARDRVMVSAATRA